MYVYEVEAANGKRTCEGPDVATAMALRLADLLGVDGRGHPALFPSFALWATILGRAAITMGEEAKAKEEEGGEDTFFL